MDYRFFIIGFIPYQKEMTVRITIEKYKLKDSVVIFKLHMPKTSRKFECVS